MKTSLLFFLFVAFFTITSAGDEEKNQTLLQCKVVDGDGKPVAGAEVFVCRPSVTTALPIIASGRTDQEGTFSSALKTPYTSDFYTQVVVMAGDAGVGVGRIQTGVRAEAAEPKRIVLQPSVDFKARIVRPDGSPAAGLEVWVGSFSLPRTDNGSFALFGEVERLPGGYWKTVTDNDGKCVIANLPKNALIYLGHSDQRFAQFYGKHHILLPSSPKADGAEHKLSLTTPGSIRGRVVLPNGQPVAGSLIYMIERTPYVTSYGLWLMADDNGRFVVDQIPASIYNLSYDTEGALVEKWIGSEKKNIDVKAGETSDVGDLVMSEVAVVTAEVVNADTGAPIEKPIKFRRAAGRHELFYRSSRMTPEGFHSPANDENVIVNVKAGERKTVQFKFRPVQSEDMGIGIVVDAAGKPVADATVMLMGENMWDGPGPVKSGNDGSFQFVLSTGKEGFAILAWNDKAMSYPLDLKRGVPAKVMIREDGFGKVIGRVCDQQGVGIKASKVQWSITGIEFGSHRFSGPIPQEFLSDDDGRFSIPRLWTANSDQLIFFVSADGYGRAALRDETVTAGQTTNLQITLKKADQNIAGVVVDDAGKPMPKVSVRVSGDSQPGDKDTITDDEGRFTISGVCAGPVYLTVYQESTRKNYNHQAKAPDQNIRIQWPASEGTVTGTVFDSEGKPFANVKIESYEQGTEVFTDDAGRFQMKDLRRGWFSVDMNGTAANGTHIEKSVRLKSGMKDVRLDMPARTHKFVSLPTIPVNLIGKQAADIKVATWINSEPLSAKAGGKVRILDFWGIQCGPCLAGFPKVQKFWAEHHDKNLEIIAVTSFYPEQEVKEFLAKHPNYTFPVALAEENNTSDRDYDIRGIPHYVVIDPVGKIVSTGHDWEEAAAVAFKLLAK